MNASHGYYEVKTTTDVMKFDIRAQAEDYAKELKQYDIDCEIWRIYASRIDTDKETEVFRYSNLIIISDINIEHTVRSEEVAQFLAYSKNDNSYISVICDSTKSVETVKEYSKGDTVSLWAKLDKRIGNTDTPLLQVISIGIEGNNNLE